MSSLLYFCINSLSSLGEAFTNLIPHSQNSVSNLSKSQTKQVPSLLKNFQLPHYDSQASSGVRESEEIATHLGLRPTFKYTNLLIHIS